MKIAEFQNGDTHLVYERRYTCDNRYMSGTRNVLQIEEMTGIIRGKRVHAEKVWRYSYYTHSYFASYFVSLENKDIEYHDAGEIIFSKCEKFFSDVELSEAQLQELNTEYNEAQIELSKELKRTREEKMNREIKIAEGL